MLASVADVVDAISHFAWPAVIAVLLWRLYPAIHSIIRSRDFSIEVAGNKITVQNASEQLHEAIEDLQRHVAVIQAELRGADQGSAAAAAPPRRLLWVDDHPENNAFLIGTLRDLDVDVVEARSTDEGVERVLAATTAPFDVIVTDMGREERGVHHPDAGVQLVRQLHDHGVRAPVVVYASERAVRAMGEAARKAGATAATSSQAELLAILHRSEAAAFVAAVADRLQNAGVTVNANASPFDLIATLGGATYGIVGRAWSSQPSPDEVAQTVAEAVRAREQRPVGVALVVNPVLDTTQNGVRVVTVDGLISLLTPFEGYDPIAAPN
jgi:CheY-like chemotaxis protein